MKWLQKYHADLLNGEGLREVIFLSGCLHHCEGCFNQESWDFNKGKDWIEEDTKLLINELRKGYIKGVTFTGGDPMYSLTVDFLENLCEIRKKENLNFDIWVYTGFTFDEVVKNNKEILLYIDVLVDGKFNKDLHKNNTKKWVGSSNQRVIDIKKTLSSGKIIEIDDLIK